MRYGMARSLAGAESLSPASQPRSEDVNGPLLKSDLGVEYSARGTAISGLSTTFWRVWLAAPVSRLGGFVDPFPAIWLGSELGLSAPI